MGGEHHDGDWGFPEKESDPGVCHADDADLLTTLGAHVPQDVNMYLLHRLAQQVRVEREIYPYMRLDPAFVERACKA